MIYGGPIYLFGSLHLNGGGGGGGGGGALK